MLIQKAYKFRIDPTLEQTTLINKTISAAVLCSIVFLIGWKDAFYKTGKGLTYKVCSAQLTGLKQEFAWLSEVDSTALQSALKHLADAYKQFFKKTEQCPLL